MGMHYQNQIGNLTAETADDAKKALCPQMLPTALLTHSAVIFLPETQNHNQEINQYT
jgi:hypothetical protein